MKFVALKKGALRYLVKPVSIIGEIAQKNNAQVYWHNSLIHIDCVVRNESYRCINDNKLFKLLLCLNRRFIRQAVVIVSKESGINACI